MKNNSHSASYCTGSNKQVHIRVDPSATTQRIVVSGKFAFCAAWEERK